MAVVGSTLDRITGTVDKIVATLPVIRSTAEELKTIVNGHPMPVVQPSQADVLVPRNVGGLDPNVAKGGISGALILGVVAVAAVFFLWRRRG